MVAFLVFPKGVQLPIPPRFIRCFSLLKERLYQPFLPLDAADQPFPSLARGHWDALCLLRVEKKGGDIFRKD